MNKKTILCILLCGIISMVPQNKETIIKADTIDKATIKGFDLSNFNTYETYKVNGNDTQIADFGTKWGTMSLYSVCATYYNKNNKSRYYFIMTEAMISSTTKNDKQYRFVNKDLSIDCHSFDDNAELIAYFPETYGSSSMSTTKTISLTASYSSSVGFKISDSGNVDLSVSGGTNLGLGISFSETYQSTNVIMTPSTTYNDDKTKKVGATLDYKFTNYDGQSNSANAPFRGDVYQRTVHVFEIKNYDYEKDIFQKFYITVNGTIAKLNTAASYNNGLSRYFIVSTKKMSLNALYTVQLF